MHAQRLFLSSVATTALACCLVGAPSRPTVAAAVGVGSFVVAPASTADAGHIALALADEPDTFIDTMPVAWAITSVATFSFHSFNTPSATFECRMDAADFAACTNPYRSDPLADGQHTFAVRAVNGAAVDQTPATYTWMVDTTAPYTGDVAVAPYWSQPVSDIVPVLISWQASDNLAPPDRLTSVVQHRRLLPSGQWSGWRLAGTTHTDSLSDSQAFGNTVQYRVRTYDIPGNRSAWVEAAPLRVLARQEGKFTLSSGWTKHELAGAWGGRIATSSTASAHANLRFTGKGVTVVMTTGADQGVVSVCVDRRTTTEQCTTVDLGAFTPTGMGIAVATFDGLTSGSHVLRVTVVAGTVNMDGAIIAR